MSWEVDINEDAGPMIRSSLKTTSPQNIKAAVGTACVRFVKQHVRSLGTNKRGWPSTGFYAEAARGTTWDETADGIMIEIDNPSHPGSMRQRYYGGEIHMKDKLLAIPARAEFYGHDPGEFTNLSFVPFGSGARALVIGKGGVGKVDFSTGRERNLKGAGVRSEAMVAYWLVESVDQKADPNVMPNMKQLSDVAIGAVVALVVQGKGNG